MKRHSFIVCVAEKHGIEAAILEGEFCFLAEMAGIESDGVTSITVPIDRLESKFYYFSDGVRGPLDDLGSSGLFEIEVDDDEGVALVYIDNRWLAYRRV